MNGYHMCQRTVLRCVLSAMGPCMCRAGRAKFLEEVHAWVRTYGGKILGQLRRMGSTPDWNRLVRSPCHGCAWPCMAPLQFHMDLLAPA